MYILQMYAVVAIHTVVDAHPTIVEEPQQQRITVVLHLLNRVTADWAIYVSNVHT